MLKEPISDEEIGKGYRTEKELNGLLRKAISEEDATRQGREYANELDRRERSRQEYRETQERERNAREWEAYFQRQRRAHLDLALDYRRRARELRGSGPEAA